MNCCLKNCPSGFTIHPQNARVEVKTALPKGGVSKLNERLAVKWKQNGEAVFHKKCWHQVLSASRVRKRKHPKQENDTAITVQLNCEKEMIRGASETAEMFDDKESVAQAAVKIAKLIESAKHCIIFTGAGISTSAGLGDFRGKGGKWTEQDREALAIQEPLVFFDGSGYVDGATAQKRLKLPYNLRGSQNLDGSHQDKGIAESNIIEEDASEEDIAYEALRPTYTHEAIQHLIETGHVKYLVSQNCDGLHLLSGVPPSHISELHGNVFVEYCEKCKTRYQRPFYVGDDVADIYLEELQDYGKTDVIPPKHMLKCKKCGLSHRTGRRCEKTGCNGFLMDTIINFHDDLEEEILDRAFASSRKCDLLICLGTTLTVTPASGIVDLIKRPQRIVICNRQATERDDACIRKNKEGEPLGVRVYADCDVLFKEVMASLLGENVAHFETSLSTKKLSYDAQRTLVQ